MPEVLAKTVERLIDAVGRSDTEGLRGEVHAERAERAGQTRRIRRWVAAGMVLIVLVGGASVGGAYLLIRQNADRISAQATRLGQVVYAQCEARRVDIVRRNALLDDAIAAEKRRPKPDAKRLRGLTDFKEGVIDCGRRP